jgi:hypothetical protein
MPVQEVFSSSFLIDEVISLVHTFFQQSHKSGPTSASKFIWEANVVACMASGARFDRSNEV